MINLNIYKLSEDLNSKKIEIYAIIRFIFNAVNNIEENHFLFHSINKEKQ